MDFLASILTSLAGGAARQIGANLYDWLKRQLNDLVKDQSETQIIQALEAIGNLADGDIRRRVEELGRLKQLSADQVEELIALLINLSHGARFHTTHGTPRSSFLRCERLLDQLLKRVLPRRRKGEPVATDGLPDWKLTRFLGMGSFGEVWEAMSPYHPERRAIKFFTSPDAKPWIKAEQKTLFHVQEKLPKHPNLVGYLDVALDGQPFPYLVLEYVNGGSLEEWILRREQDRPALDRRTLVEGVVRGLAQAHEQGIAHRDLKPANVLLAVTDTDVLPKITDFGLGRAEASRIEASAQVSQGLAAGTTMYLPPEALQRLRPGRDLVSTAGRAAGAAALRLCGSASGTSSGFANHPRDRALPRPTRPALR
jgi:hypothetical protein